MRELMARVAALLRRHDRAADRAQPASAPVHSAQLSLDRERRQAVVRGERVELTKQEFDLLYLLAAQPGVVFSAAAGVER
ncbi:MAG TPA: hypothetical protein VFD69_05045 [Vicinamibacterales bacterium]|nr:hypothetical protein [Vicinamibacterales bacterium]